MCYELSRKMKLKMSENSTTRSYEILDVELMLSHRGLHSKIERLHFSDKPITIGTRRACFQVHAKHFTYHGFGPFRKSTYYNVLVSEGSESEPELSVGKVLLLNILSTPRSIMDNDYGCLQNFEWCHSRDAIENALGLLWRRWATRENNNDITNYRRGRL